MASSPDHTPERPGTARMHALLAGTVLFSIVAELLILDVLARDERLAGRYLAAELDQARATGGIFGNAGHFLDIEDRLLLDELPRDDYSRGGVYFIGSSNLKWALADWRWSPEDKALIHNYGIGATNHRAHFQLLRFLVEQRGLLQAGGENSLIVFGVSYHVGGHENNDSGFFANIWRRHGLYTYDPATGIRSRRVPAFVRAWTVEKARTGGFARRTIDYLRSRIVTGAEETRRRKHVPSEYNDYRREIMGPGWREKLESNLVEFAGTFDYLKARHARILVVLLPQGSWESNLPYASSYADMVRALCRSKGVPLVDLLDYLPDEDFADSNHLNLSGVDKVDAILVRLAKSHIMNMR